MAEITIPLMLIYLLPSVSAIVRGHQSWWAIVALNLLLGWTVIGWIAALIWSLTAPRWQTTIVVTEHFHGEDETKPSQWGLAKR